jgi:hypothetical protein
MAEPKPSRNGLFPVRFIQPAAPFNAGDVAGFPRDKAQKMVELGFAVWAPETVPAEETKAKKKAKDPAPVEDGTSQDEPEAEEEPKKSRRRRRFGSRSEQ